MHELAVTKQHLGEVRVKFVLAICAELRSAKLANLSVMRWEEEEILNILNLLSRFFQSWTLIDLRI